jgi:hypothetical protein
MIVVFHFALVVAGFGYQGKAGYPARPIPLELPGRRADYVDIHDQVSPAAERLVANLKPTG